MCRCRHCVESHPSPSIVFLSTLRRRQRLLDGNDQDLIFERAVVALSVDEKGGSAVHSAADASAEVIADPLLVHTVCERLLQRAGGNLQLFGKFGVEFLAQAFLVVEETVVHLPESSLGG